MCLCNSSSTKKRQMCTNWCLFGYIKMVTNIFHLTYNISIYCDFSLIHFWEEHEYFEVYYLRKKKKKWLMMLKFHTHLNKCFFLVFYSINFKKINMNTNIFYSKTCLKFREENISLFQRYIELILPYSKYFLR